jgi:2-amino-4-hydroxy-6-hydroxymethyldihydropteridine diphosphokinase
MQSVPAPVAAYIGLGANLGDASATVLQAVQAIAELDGVMLLRQSSLYTSAPIDSSGPDYINAVVEVRTHRNPLELLRHLQDIELRAGRVRLHRNAPRTLDLDLLLHGDAQINTAALTLPHPRMWLRAFVVHPLAEIAPHLVAGSRLRAVEGQGIARLS